MICAGVSKGEATAAAVLGGLGCLLFIISLQLNGGLPTQAAARSAAFPARSQRAAPAAAAEQPADRFLLSAPAKAPEPAPAPPQAAAPASEPVAAPQAAAPPPEEAAALEPAAYQPEPAAAPAPRLVVTRHLDLEPSRSSAFLGRTQAPALSRPAAASAAPASPMSEQAAVSRYGVSNRSQIMLRASGPVLNLAGRRR